MDDKSLNLWRQIEDSRRRGRPQHGNRSKPAPPPDRQTLAPWQAFADNDGEFHSSTERRLPSANVLASRIAVHNFNAATRGLPPRVAGPVSGRPCAGPLLPQQP